MIIGFFKKLFSRRKKRPLTLVEYGRYLHKPIAERAIALVTGLPNYKDLVRNEQVFLNDEIVKENDLGRRLESGQYEIAIPRSFLAWRFFIS